MLSTGSKIRLATVADEAEVITMVRLMHGESGLFSLDIDRVRETLSRAWGRKGGSLWVIGQPGNIRAMLYITIEMHWYTKDTHLSEVFCWVHPQHRNSDYAKLLIQHAKECSDKTSARAGFNVPLTMGVFTGNRMAAKVRLYRRFFGLPVGAYFVYNAEWVGKHEPTNEDFFRVPSVAKWFRKRTERADRKRERIGA